MSKIGQSTLLSMSHELVKLSISWNAVGSGVGSLGGAGLLAGGAIGAGVGGYKSYREARRQGATAGQAIKSSLGGAASGGLRGGQIGGAVGALGGGAIGAISPVKANSLRTYLSDKPVVGAFSRFGQRQVHGLTGWTPSGMSRSQGLKSMRHGSYSSSENLKALNAQNASGKDIRGLTDKLLGRSNKDVLANAEKGLRASTRAEEMGLTSIPGYAKSFRDNGIKNTLSAGFKDQWYNSGPVMKALMIGAPAIEAGRQAMQKEDPSHPNQGRLERVGKSLATTGANLVMSPLPAVTQLGLSGLVSGAGGSVGKGVGKFFDYPKKPSLKGQVLSPASQDLLQDSGQAVPGERIVSERAAGSLGEGSPT